MRDTNLWAPEDITDYSGHGTSVASVAGGITRGVASNANLVLVKFKQAAKNSLPGGSGNYLYGSVPAAAVWAAWNFAIQDALQQRRDRPDTDKGNFIINMSHGRLDPVIALMGPI